ncbi:MAG: FmdE family protein [Thermodesulfobacteriota bacterium]
MQATICNHTYEEYLENVKAFHGHAAPGMVIGGFMVDLAQKNLPRDGLFDAICETRACLPDSIQLLTPCTIGNGWLKILDFGRFALTLYDKFNGQGVRVFVNQKKLKDWPEVNAWFFKLKSKQEQPLELLMDEIRRAGNSYCDFEAVQVAPGFLQNGRRKGFTVCASCNEAYPADHGPLCRACQGRSPYVRRDGEGPKPGFALRPLRSVPAEQAGGLHALHDMTEIIAGEKKGPAFQAGQRIEGGDLCRLQKMGRARVYVREANDQDGNWVHEDEAALAFARAMAGPGTVAARKAREGKAEVLAGADGLFVSDAGRLEAFNLAPGVLCACRNGFSVVKKGDKLAGARALPIYLHQGAFDQAMEILEEAPLFLVREMKKARVGILVTGTEVFRGLVQDRFAPIIRKKVEHYGCVVDSVHIVPDDRDRIRRAARAMKEAGAELLVTTAGLSVDPDDVTRQGLEDAGVTDLLYGAPILPGNMTLLARMEKTRVVGVPACALFHGRTSFDILLPRLLADVPITRQDLSAMGEGGLCLECPTCSFPQCSFGK